MFSSSVIKSFLVLALVAAAAIAYPADTNDQTLVEVITVGDISQLKDLPEGAKLIPLENGREVRGSIRYTLGSRVSGDRLVSQGSDSVTYNSLQNVQLRLEYPANGNGALISYVQIDVNQSSNDGRAYVVSGGIGQRRIVIIVEAYNTRYFSYVARIYGI